MNTWYQMWGKTYQYQISNAGGWFIGVIFSKFHDFSMTFDDFSKFHDFPWLFQKILFFQVFQTCVNLIYDVMVCGVHFTNDFLLQFKYDGTVVFFPVIQLLTTIVCTYHDSTVANHCVRIEVIASVYAYLLNLNRNWKKVSETGLWYNWKNKLKQCYRLWSPVITR